MHYPLEVLNDKEFEELAKDLLEPELRVGLQIFKSGRDKGIDLRYSCDVENEVIVQAKHYIRSGFAQLKAEMAKEKRKMDDLPKKPKRYILITSQALNVGQTDILVDLLHPYIQSSQDIYGGNRVMSLISDDPTVETKHYKLWITSTTVLNRILHNAAYGRSAFYKEKILSQISRYVPTANFQTAVNKLMENHFIIVSGEPGIGKTTISYLLICDLMANGYQLIYVDEKLQDAELLLSPSADEKQIIFFDDFFGANLSELIQPRNSESKIVGFIERIQATPNKLLVLTSRTTILNQARHRFEKFNRSGLSDLSKYELNIQAYSKLDKARILYNHLFYANIPTEQYDVFFDSRNYLKIIEHKNYFPRLIEFITSASRLKTVAPSDTKAFIFESLNNPSEIWQFAFDRQLKEEDQFLLTTLFSLGGYQVAADELEKAFESRYAFEIKNNGFVLSTDAYLGSLKNLMEGFVSSQRNHETGKVTFSFLNPSVGDFMLNYLRRRPAEQKRILFSVAYFKQIIIYFTPGIPNGLEIPEQYQQDYYVQFGLLVPELIANAGNKLSARITALYIYFRFFKDMVTEKVIRGIYNDTEFIFSNEAPLAQFIYVLHALHEYEDIRGNISSNWKWIFSGAFEKAEDSRDFCDLLSLMEDFDIYQTIWSNEKDFLSTVGLAVNCCYAKFDVDLSSYEDEIIDAHASGYDAFKIVDDKVTDDYASFLTDCELSDFFEEFVVSADFNVQSLLDHIIESHSRYDDDDDYRYRRESGNDYPVDENTAIDRLFDR